MAYTLVSEEDINTATSQINSLVAYANGITKKSDTRIGDAVRSLASGYGQGGSTSLTMATATATSSSNATSITFTVEGEPKNLFAVADGSTTTVSTTRVIAQLFGNSSQIDGTVSYRSGSTNYTSYADGYTSSYNASTKRFTITSKGTSTGGVFASGHSYVLVYYY